MEATADRKATLKLIREAMPRVSDIVRRKRLELGDAFVTQCQQRGMSGEPGWFYAREGALAIGRLWPEAMQAEGLAIPAGVDVGDIAIVCIRNLEAEDGAH